MRITDLARPLAAVVALVAANQVGAQSTLYQFDGDAASSFLGGAVSGAGDTNNDGFDDVILGAPFADANGLNSGSIMLITRTSIPLACARRATT